MNLLNTKQKEIPTKNCEMPGVDVFKSETVYQFLNYTRQTPTCYIIPSSSTCRIISIIHLSVYHPETKESHLTWLPTWQRHSGVLDGAFLSMRLPSAHPISESLETNADTL